MELFSVISFRGETISGEDQRPDPGDGGNRAYHRRCREISAVFSGYKKCKSLFHLSLTHMVQIYTQFHISHFTERVTANDRYHRTKQRKKATRLAFSRLYFTNDYFDSTRYSDKSKDWYVPLRFLIHDSI